MPKYVIERELPGAGALSEDQLGGIARRSCDVLRDLGPGIQWVHSYVTDDKIYCVYIAPDEATIVEHARRGGFPADSKHLAGQGHDRSDHVGNGAQRAGAGLRLRGGPGTRPHHARARAARANPPYIA